MDDAGLGTKIRAVRRREGLTQAQLAERLSISPSYLNLIEHGRRPLPAHLLIELARQLHVDLATFAADADLDLEVGLREALSDPLFDEHGLVGADVRDLVRTAPPVARALLTLYRAYQRTRAASDEGPADTDEVDRAGLSTEQVSDFVQHRLNWFPELEEAAEDLWRDAALDPQGSLGRSTSVDPGPALERWLRTALRIEVRYAPPMVGAVTRRYDPDRRELVLSEALPPWARTFELAHTTALVLHSDTLDRLCRDERLTTDASRALGRVVLANWFAGAVVMPYDRLLTSARELRYDVELLGLRFRTSWEQVCHRLTSLRRPGREGVPFHLLRVDVAGNISKRFSASGIRFPRFSGVCARWNVFQAFQAPGMVRTQVSQMADGAVYFCFSRTVRRDFGGFHAAPALYAVGMGCRVEHARELVYSDGIDLEGATVPIGVNCRSCHRTDCAQRVCPPVDHPLKLDPNVRGVSLFAPPEPG